MVTNYEKIAAVVVLRRRQGRNLRRNRVFRDRNNSLEMYDDVALYDIVVLTIVCENNKVDELRNDLEYTEQHAAPCRLSCKSWWHFADVCDRRLSVFGG